MSNNAMITNRNASVIVDHASANHVYARQIHHTKRNGGGTFTVNGYRGDTPVDGYMIGGLIETMVIDGDAMDDASLRVAFMMYQSRIPQTINDDVYFGTWVNPDDGLWHLDASQHVASRDDAIALARERNELAIYDIASGDSIFV